MTISGFQFLIAAVSGLVIGIMISRILFYKRIISLTNKKQNNDEKLVHDKDVELENLHSKKIEEYSQLSDRLNEALKLSEEKYRIAFSTNPDSISISSFDGVYIDVNEGFTRLMGYDRTEAIGISTFDLNIWVNTLEREVFMNELQTYGNIQNMEAEFFFKGKIKKTGLISGSVIIINGEKHILSIARDITEHKKLLNALIISENKFRTIFNSTRDGIVILDKALNIIDINDSLVCKLNLPNETLIGININTLLNMGKIVELNERIAAFWQGETIQNFETDIKISDELIYKTEISASAFYFENERALILIIRDISRRRKLEHDLLHSVINTEENERLRFSQELHDGLGPVISAAKLYTQWLHQPNANLDRNEVIQDIEALLEEAGQSIRDISFKISPHILQNFGIVEAMKAYSEKIMASGKIHIEINAHEMLKLDNIVEIVIYRMLCECITNTLKHAKAALISINFEIIGNTLNIIYMDNGKGFNVEKAFSDFKGIGLLNMQSRIKSINGKFSMLSTPETGTKILIQLAIA